MSQGSVDLSHKVRGGEVNNDGKLAFLPIPLFRPCGEISHSYQYQNNKLYTLR